MTLAYNLCNEDLTFQSVRCGKSEPGELLTTAFGDLTQSKDLRSCVLRVLEEVKEGDEKTNVRDRKIQSEAAKLANKKFRDYIKKKVVPREDAIQCAYNGINYFRARSAANEKEVEETRDTVWESIKDKAGADVYAKSEDGQERNAHFNKILTRKFERLAEKAGDEIIQVAKKQRTKAAATTVATAISDEGEESRKRSEGRRAPATAAAIAVAAALEEASRDGESSSEEDSDEETE